jgi:hypothetical protein
VILLAAGIAFAGDAGDPVVADTVRVGVFVGNDVGHTGEASLIFASKDAAKMRDVFTAWGGIAPDDAVLLVDQPARNVQSALIVARQRVADAHAAGHRAEVVFYYSGHGDQDGLHLGETTIADDTLRAWLEATGADVRLAFLDSCRSGGVVRAKGGVRGPSYAFAVQVEDVKGTAFVTSSASTEFSQESEELGGGFFTHYLATALAGAADADHDGGVTLDEAYAWVHGETVFGTREAAGVQTPAFDFDLSGSGQVRLTRFEAANAWIEFPGGLDGTYAVWDDARKRFVAEVIGAEPTKIAVHAGVYDVDHRMPGWVDEARYVVAAGSTTAVTEDDFASVAYDDTAARGAIEKEVRQASRPDLEAELLVGGRGFAATSVYATQYFPTHPIAGGALRFRFHNGMYLELDSLAGQGSGALVLQQQQIPVIVTTWTGGATLGLATSFWRFFDAGFGARGESVWMGRTFPDAAVEPQSGVNVSPGLQVFGGLHAGHLQGRLTFNGQFLPVAWDGNRPQAYGELLLSAGLRL